MMEQAAPAIYIVDDEPQTRASMAALLESLGHASRTFASAEQLLAGLRPGCRGCVLSDYRLPGMNGLELHDALRAAGHYLPVVLVSAFFNVRVAASALEKGVFRILEKPFTRGELENAARLALSADGAWRAQQTCRLDLEHRLRSLDDRQRLTLQLVLSGQTNKTIEHRLGVSRRTVERARAAILAKMNATSFVELAAALAGSDQRGQDSLFPSAEKVRGTIMAVTEAG